MSVSLDQSPARPRARSGPLAEQYRLRRGCCPARRCEFRHAQAAFGTRCHDRLGVWDAARAARVMRRESSMLSMDVGLELIEEGRIHARLIESGLDRRDCDLPPLHLAPDVRPDRLVAGIGLFPNG